MKYLLAVILFAVTTISSAQMYSHTYIVNGRMVTCTTTCYGNNCTTSCI
jgi:hypothetical protein